MYGSLGAYRKADMETKRKKEEEQRRKQEEADRKAAVSPLSPYYMRRHIYARSLNLPPVMNC